MKSTRSLLGLLGACALVVACSGAGSDPLFGPADPAASTDPTSGDGSNDSTSSSTSSSSGGSSTSSSSGSSSGGSSSGSSSGGSSSGGSSGGSSSSSSGALACADPGDAPGTEATALLLPSTDDCDNGVLVTKAGVAAGALDVDVYRFKGTDKLGCVVDPTVTTATPNLQICQFVTCVAGATTFVGCNGGTPTKSPAGLDGCCVTTPGSASPLFDCAGGTDDAYVFMRVRGLVDACTPYTLGYHY